MKYYTIIVLGLLLIAAQILFTLRAAKKIDGTEASLKYIAQLACLTGCFAVAIMAAGWIVNGWV